MRVEGAENSEKEDTGGAEGNTKKNKVSPGHDSLHEQEGSQTYLILKGRRIRRTVENKT